MGMLYEERHPFPKALPDEAESSSTTSHQDYELFAMIVIAIQL